MRASLAFLLVLLASTTAHAANILFVADSDGDLELVTALRADGNTVEQVVRDFSGGSNTRLSGSLDAYDAVYWSADGTGSGDAHTDPGVFSNLTTYVMNGGRVFVTGYDSIASPDDPMLWAFLGATGSSDTPGSPGPIIDEENSLTVGVSDIRGIMPASVGDMDCLRGLGTDTVAVVTTATDPACAQWSLRTLGEGEIAYVTSSGGGTYWSSDTSPYSLAARNFVFGTDSTSGDPGAPVIEFVGPVAADEGSAIAITASVMDNEGDFFTLSWDLDGDGTFGENAGADTYTVRAGTTDGPTSVRIGVEAIDRGGHRAQRYRTIRVVNVAPSVRSTPPTVASVDTELHYQIIANDPAGSADPLTYTLTSGPSRMAVTPSGVVQWTPAASDLTRPGDTIPIEVTIADGDGGETSHAWELVVSRNRQPTPPAPVFPIDGIGIIDRTPRLAVTNSQDLDFDPLTYFFQIDTVSTFDSPNLRESGPIPEMPGFTAWQIDAPLDENRFYHWRVWSNDGLFDSETRETTFWVVRDPSLPPPDAGPPIERDGGVVSGPDAGMRPMDGGCSAAPRGGSRAPIALVVGLAIALFRRRVRT